MKRVRLLCEDRRAERFLRTLCQRFGVKVLEIVIAPKGRGAASDWVLAQYPRLTRQHRSQKFQRNLGLLVHIDGDAAGVQARKSALDASLAASNPPLGHRKHDEPVAIFVPTWCIETWLLHLAGISQPPETARLKRYPDPAHRPAMGELEADETAVIERAVKAWPGASSPSLQDAATEGRRIGFH